jgi:hypothetical protein
LCINNDDELILMFKYADVLTISLDGGITDPDKERDTDYRPIELLDGGMHHQDHGRHHIRNVTRALGHQPLPRDIMLKIIQEKDLKGPTPANWKE